MEILVYTAQGNSNKQIAKALSISDQTVKNHITSILKKLSVNDRTAAVVHALRHRWITKAVTKSTLSASLVLKAKYLGLARGSRSKDKGG